MLDLGGPILPGVIVSGKKLFDTTTSVHDSVVKQAARKNNLVFLSPEFPSVCIARPVFNA